MVFEKCPVWSQLSKLFRFIYCDFQAAEKEYFELTLGNPLKDQLADKSIVEYPTIHVLLPGSLGNFASAKISKAVPPKVLVPDEIVGDRIQDPQELEGVPFKEEDFEEGEYLEDGEIISWWA